MDEAPLESLQGFLGEPQSNEPHFYENNDKDEDDSSSPLQALAEPVVPEYAQPTDYQYPPESELTIE